MNFEQFKNKFQKVPVDHYPHQVTEKPVVSVCVQTYQHVKFINECLDGILMQKTDFPFEILLGEDASTDGTREICIEYADKYPGKIKLFLHNRSNNIAIEGSPSGRFNFLHNLFSANGKYIAMCEGDDYWTDPFKLKKQVDAMEVNASTNICSHPSIKYDEEKKKKLHLIGDNGKSSRIIPIQEIILRFGYVCPMQSILIRNIKIAEFTNLALNTFGAHGQMQVFWSHPSGVLYLSDIMAVYRTNSVNSITKKVLTNKDYFLKVLLDRNYKLMELDKYFNNNYSKDFNQKIRKNNYDIVGSRLIPFNEKMKIIKERKGDFTIPIILRLLIRSFLSKVKHIIN